MKGTGEDLSSGTFAEGTGCSRSYGREVARLGIIGDAFDR